MIFQDIIWSTLTLKKLYLPVNFHRSPSCPVPKSPPSSWIRRKFVGHPVDSTADIRRRQSTPDYLPDCPPNFLLDIRWFAGLSAPDIPCILHRMSTRHMASFRRIQLEGRDLGLGRGRDRTRQGFATVTELEWDQTGIGIGRGTMGIPAQGFENRTFPFCKL